ncbi:hypothetical protein M422DRAFT_273002 [Sphaerobolus stellatus SS14]|uniref:Uncharacterized protein n=1 Tax=Sphaerobolus stellatus (strain SS14) TaxID=990650 RepID=A0A0C9UL91_SPHS4|nr:hypothetical protein M422DRAFT_273002 [Sphaerobolus stellatus SS14]
MTGWDPRRNYYACELEPPRQTGPTFWRKLHGDVLYDEHPKEGRKEHEVKAIQEY